MLPKVRAVAIKTTMCVNILKQSYATPYPACIWQNHLVVFKGNGN